MAAKTCSLLHATSKPPLSFLLFVCPTLSLFCFCPADLAYASLHVFALLSENGRPSKWSSEQRPPGVHHVGLAYANFQHLAFFGFATSFSPLTSRVRSIVHHFSTNRLLKPRKHKKSERHNKNTQRHQKHN